MKALLLIELMPYRQKNSLPRGRLLEFVSSSKYTRRKAMCI